MKTIFIIIVSLFVVVSCSNNTTDTNKNFVKETDNLTIKTLSFDELQKIAIKVDSLNNLVSLKTANENEIEDELIDALDPLIENGREIHRQIESDIDFNDPEYELEPEDINAINNLTDQQYAELSLFYSSVQLAVVQGTNSDWDRDRVFSCIGSALGLNELYEIAVVNTAELMTAKAATKILKLVARRYVGWIGVAVAAYSFGSCMGQW